MSDKYPGKVIIGLTGNIATGKTVIRRMIEHLGAFGIDADGLAHRAMSPGAPAYEPVVKAFGQYILNEDKQINRARLGKIVFTDPDALKLLESITHPFVQQAINIMIKRAKQQVVVVEAIKLLESETAKNYDSIWVVDAGEEIRVARLIKDRGMSEADAKMRVSAQNAQADKVKKGDVVIDNGKDYEHAFEQVKKNYEAVTQKVLGKEAAAPEPEPEPTIVTPAVEGEVQVSIKRGGPADAAGIAAFLNELNKSNLSRQDVLLSFGQKAYMLALAEDKIVGLAGWKVENLITRIDEFLLGSGAPVQGSTRSLLETIEKASDDLQSEIMLLFIRKQLPPAVKQVAEKAGYEMREISELKVPDWREAATESSPADDATLMAKKMRTDRVLKPL